MTDKFTIQRVKDVVCDKLEVITDTAENHHETYLSAKSTRFSEGVNQKSYEKNHTYQHRTFGRDTVEVLPMEHYYRNADTVRTKLFRPTLTHLHDKQAQSTAERIGEIQQNRERAAVAAREDIDKPENSSNKFGWIQGVLVRCLLNIWGVILFLRMSWIVGEAGVVYSILIIALATVVTVLTTISMSAICTNGVVRGGGAYFLISRSLGPEFGGAIGLIFSLANAVAVSMYTVGFSETVRDMLKASDLLMVSEAHDVRIIGCLTLLLLLGITQAGMAWESKAQLGLLVILLIAITNYVIGCFFKREYDSTDLQANGTLHYKQLNSEGHFSLRTDLLQENLYSAYSEGENFFTVFSIFFPAATGILAGSNISGDLKDPSIAIPKGTFSAIGITSVSYIILAILLGSHSARTATGFYGQKDDISGICTLYNDDIMANGTVTHQCLDDYVDPLGFKCQNEYSSAACKSGWNYTIVEKCTASFNDAGMNCRFGLKGDYSTMSKISAVPHLITAGIFAATLSSALACLVSAPKVFQALANDKVIPKIAWFGKPYGRGGEARRAYALTFVIAVCFILIGELNLIAPVISNFFLASYCLINYSCFSASLAKSPGWRPSFKYYNKWAALFASFICIVIMFIADWAAALITFVCVASVYKMIDYRSLDINWGSSGQAFTYQQALKYTQRLASVDDHVKNFRPQILCFSGPPEARPELVSLASQMTHNIALCIFGDVQSSFQLIKETKQAHQNYLQTNGIKGIYKPTQAVSLGEGAVQLMASAGIGKLTPNVILLGFMHTWKERAVGDMTSYYNMIHDAFTYNYGVVILHAEQGLNKTPARKTSEDMTGSPDNKSTKTRLLNCCTSGEPDNPLLGDGLLFRGTIEDRIIDVYWLFDDGGLTLLLPYILTLRKYWSKAKIRLFTPGREDQLERDQINVSSLCKKFRIETSEVQILTTLNKTPTEESRERFNQLIAPFRVEEEDEDLEKRDESEEENNDTINDDLITKFSKKTDRQLRINELMREHSSKSDLVCVTLPMVRVGTCPAAMYMAWLESISYNLPPVLMLRGNQESVLTFYS